MHTLNDQVFRGFFTGRYIFTASPGFLRYASPAAAGGFGPQTVGCSTRLRDDYVTAPGAVPGGIPADGGPLLLYLQGAGRTGPATDAAGASTITNDEFSLFVQDQWQIRPNLTVNYGLRWDAQLMPETVDPRRRRSRAFLSDPTFPSDGTIPDQWEMFQPRVGVAWDVKGDGKSVVRASCGVYYARQNMLSQVGSVTTNGLQQQTMFVSTGNLTAFGAPTPVWPGVLSPAPLPDGQFPLFSGVRVFDETTRTRASIAFNVAYEQELAPDCAGYVDFTWNEGTRPDAVPELQPQRAGRAATDGPGTGNTYVYSGAPWGPQLGEVMVANSRGRVAISRPDARRPQALLERLSSSKPTTCWPRTRTTTRTSAIRSPIAASISSTCDWTGAVGSRHPPQGERLRLLHHAAAACSSTPACSTAARSRSPPARAASTAWIAAATASARTTSSSRSTGGVGAPVPVRRALRDHADHRDVQHVQQRQQHQPAQHAGAVQLRRVPAHRRRRSAAGAAGGEVDVLTRGSFFAARFWQWLLASRNRTPSS